MRRLIILAVTIAAPVGAQNARIFYPAPPASAVSVSRNVQYAAVDTGALRMDVYRPNTGSAARSPVLVFFTTGSQRANYAGLGRIAASKGIVAVLGDLRSDSLARDFRTMLTAVMSRAAMYGIDTARIAVFGASNGASNSFPVVQDSLETRIKASVMYYGGAEVTRFRRDLPVLYVRAGLDRPLVNASVDSGIMRALAANAPITVINYSGGHHSFEGTDDNIITRDLIDQTIDFVKRVTAPAYRADLVASVGYATAAAQVAASDFRAAAATYATLVARKPDDAHLRLSYGESLLADRQFEAACGEFEKLKGKGLGPRDLGLPAARACLQKGDVGLALAWLSSIPKPFLPARVKDEPVFAALRDRPEFMKLFDP
jgi:dienelactone hydrolase